LVCLEYVNLSGTGLVVDGLLALAEQLGKFPALQRLNVSANPGLRLLPISVLQMAATLQSFSCQSCSLVLPPQSFFSSVFEENPGRIRQLLQSGSLATHLGLSSLHLTATVAREIATLLAHFPALQRLDISDNPGLDHTAVSLILKALSGKAHHLYYPIYVLTFSSMPSTDLIYIRSCKVCGAEPQ
jgi:hypothetical protein